MTERCPVSHGSDEEGQIEVEQATRYSLVCQGAQDFINHPGSELEVIDDLRGRLAGHYAKMIRHSKRVEDAEHTISRGTRAAAFAAFVHIETASDARRLACYDQALANGEVPELPEWEVINPSEPYTFTRFYSEPARAFTGYASARLHRG